MTTNNKKDTQGQNNNIAQQQSSIEQISTNGFESFGLTFSKKSERLATALYLVTNFLSDIEPIKFRLRTLSVSLIETAYVVRHKHVLDAHIFDAVRSSIVETLTLLELAFITGLVSEMNFQILKREYGTLRDLVDVRKASRDTRSDSILGEAFFEPTFSKGHSESKMSFMMSDTASVVSPKMSHKPEHVAVVGKGQIQQMSTTGLKEKKNIEDTTAETKSQRSGEILKLIKDKREVSIKDIAVHFPNYSEKTIQRELTAMVDAGVLKKIGERRWSRYAVL